MHEAVWELLDLDRLREGTPLARSTLEVAELLEDARDGHGMVASLGAVELGEGRILCPAVHADRRVILRVIANLLTNAMKHNPPGVRVVLDAENGEDPGQVTFTCSDNGRGIPEDLAPRLFTEFRAGADSAQTDSTGLGLAFCREAIEAHGGRIWCERPESSGARFRFTLPVAGGAAPQ
jgi:signal transduction histidine kinase